MYIRTGDFRGGINEVTSGLRLQVEEIDKRVFVHNYGHGGSGLSLSGGAGEEAADLLREAVGKPSSKTEIAVLGCGVIGLTTALCLLRRIFLQGTAIFLD